MARTAHKNKSSNSSTIEFSGQLLTWYDKNARSMPWRAPKGVTPDPYHIWLSEIMLQQTTVTAVIPYYLKFLALWPTIHDLANAPKEQVMKEWAGLGYYARARNLHTCAQVVSNEFKGHFPSTPEELKALPGIGDYTSASITAIAFNTPAIVVDGNVERVVARYFAIEEPLPGSKHLLKKLAADLYDPDTSRPGDLAQAMMELGATICIPKAPRCGLCPVSENCQSRALGIQATLPRKVKKAGRPQKFGYIYWITNPKGQVVVHERPEKGLLGGMKGLPTSEWLEKKARIKDMHYEAIPNKFIEETEKLPTNISHVFTHFDLELQGVRLKATKTMKLPPQYTWTNPKDLESIGFPSVFQKALSLFLNKKPIS